MATKQQDYLDGKQIPVIKVKLGEREFILDAQKDLFVSNDLDTELDKQPALFAWYASCAEDARDKAAKLTNQIKALEDQLFLDAQGPVETRKAQARVDPAVQKLKKQLLKAESVSRHCDVMVKAFDQRRWMIHAKCSRRFGEDDISLKKQEEVVRQVTTQKKRK